ncbi:hypothetical protein C7E19_07735 [Stenotrophomonas maltophilia]|nr:hypothetical protein C7E19_07735 [Stenotrophomonas maltophilia]QDY49711.1 hypothetical protein DUW70_14810 [Stenotrophomonas maltophilia]
MYRLGASAGLHPAPAVVPAAGRQPQRQLQKRISCGMAEWIPRSVGTAFCSGGCRPWSTQ